MARLRELEGDRHPLRIGMGIFAGERMALGIRQKFAGSTGPPPMRRSCGRARTVWHRVRCLWGMSGEDWVHPPPPRDRGVPRRAKWTASPLGAAECEGKHGRGRLERRETWRGEGRGARGGGFRRI